MYTDCHTLSLHDALPVLIQPVADLAALAHAAGALMLCDAVQGYGRVPIPDTCDLVAISGHKIHGHKGIGALWIRDGVTLKTLLHGGGQEGIGRASCRARWWQYVERPVVDG